MRSSDNRKTKQILTQQKKYKHPIRCLYSEIEANAYSLKLDLNEIDDNNIKKIRLEEDGEKKNFKQDQQRIIYKK